MLTFAFCTYKRADRLGRLVSAMRAQDCPIPFEILAVNNNSPDDTLQVLERLAKQPGAPMRYVTETEQGIVPARNRALAEAMSSDILVFIDDDELPLPGLLRGACHAILEEGARCAGGRIGLDFTDLPRPSWLGDDLCGFLGALDHGPHGFWLQDTSRPIWSGNVAYDMRLFRDNHDLRFDKRYNRVGDVVGGGSDAILLRLLLSRHVPTRYCPQMGVLHAVEPWRLQRRYFLSLQYRAGFRYGRFQLPEYPRKIMGLPRFLLMQFLRQCWKTAAKGVRMQGGVLRQAMNTAHTGGALIGYLRRE